MNELKTEIGETIPESTEKKLGTLKAIFNILRPLGPGLLSNEKVIQAAKALGLKSSNEDILNEFKGHLISTEKKEE